MKLHLGCGRDHKEGYINCDISQEVNPNRIVNLEKILPFKDNSVNEIIINHTLEHIKNLYQLMEEFQRICKNKALIKIKVPYFSSESAFSTITHIRFFSLTSFDFFDKRNPRNYDAPNVNMEVTKKVLHWRKCFIFMELLNKSPKLLRIYQEVFCWILPARELEVELKIKKKNRGNSSDEK